LIKAVTTGFKPWKKCTLEIQSAVRYDQCFPATIQILAWIVLPDPKGKKRLTILWVK